MSELLCEGEPVEVEPKAIDVLAYLNRHHDWAITKDELIENIWKGHINLEAAITSRINLVRNAVGDTGREQAVPKRGVQFVAAAEIRGPLNDPIRPRKHQLLDLVMPFRDLSRDGAGIDQGPDRYTFAGANLKEFGSARKGSSLMDTLDLFDRINADPSLSAHYSGMPQASLCLQASDSDKTSSRI